MSHRTIKLPEDALNTAVEQYLRSLSLIPDDEVVNDVSDFYDSGREIELKKE